LNTGRLTMRWKLKSGPGTVTIIGDRLPMRIGHSRRHRGATTASFSEPGTYVLTFIAEDGQAQTMEDLVIHAKGDSFSTWQHSHFTTAELAQELVSGTDADPDIDGMSNQAEYIAGTSPRNTKSLLEIRKIQLGRREAIMRVDFLSAPHRNYRLLQSPSVLGPWKLAEEIPAPPNGGPVKLFVPLDQALGQSQFFRLEIPTP